MVTYPRHIPPLTPHWLTHDCDHVTVGSSPCWGVVHDYCRSLSVGMFPLESLRCCLLQWAVIAHGGLLVGGCLVVVLGVKSLIHPALAAQNVPGHPPITCCADLGSAKGAVAVVSAGNGVVQVMMVISSCHTCATKKMNPRRGWHIHTFFPLPFAFFLALLRRID